MQEQQRLPIRLIWAQARDLQGHTGAMGLDGGMPWRLPPDLRYFKAKTLGCPVIMGRRSWEAMPERFRPLPERTNIVVTHDASYQAQGAEVYTSLHEAIHRAYECLHEVDLQKQTDPAVWVIGGAVLLQDAIAFADEAYVTEIFTQVKADTFAPDIEAYCAQSDWHLARAGELQTATIYVDGRAYETSYRFNVYAHNNANTVDCVNTTNTTNNA